MIVFSTCILSLEKTIEVTIEAKKIDENIVKIKFCIIENI
jgi:hypothetical protein